MMTDELVFIGNIVLLEDVPNADFIVSATVVCGRGGKWKGIVRKAEFQEGDACLVYLPDSLVPNDDPDLEFMKSSSYRVKMRRLRGTPSEVLIMPNRFHDLSIGFDCTSRCRVTKYHKPVAAHLQGIAKGNFPDFIPKTDELNYQRYGDLVDALVGQPYYITEKCDGSSTTAYRYKDNFGLCSRNLELEKNIGNGYWDVCVKHELEQKLPDDYAIQWETCGPKIQSNPMELNEIQGFLFSGYRISEHRYLTFAELRSLSAQLAFPMVRVLSVGNSFTKDGIELLGEGLYDNGKQREGVVVRSQDNVYGKPISFKVINLNYET